MDSKELDGFREAILGILQEEWRDLLGDVREQDAPALLAVAHGAATYGAKLAAGDPEAARDLAYVKANALLLTATVALREKERVEALFLKIADVAARLLGEFILKIPVPPGV